MIKKFIFYIFWYLNFSFAREAPSNEEGCIINGTYILNVHIHTQNEIKDAIVSLASKARNSNLLDEIQAVSGEKAAVVALKSYYGTVAEELNLDFERFGVQINIILDDNEIDQISANGAYDPSCEIGSALNQRNNAFYTNLTSKLNNVVGFHLSVYGCIYNNSNVDKIDVIANSHCGRIVGIMWDGSDNTKKLIKSGITEALSSAKDAYANGFLDLISLNQLCIFMEKCLGKTPTVHGQRLDIKKSLRYIEDDASDTHIAHENIIH